MTPFKRSSSVTAPYYVRFVLRGRRYVRCLNTADLVLARKAARTVRKQIADALVRGDMDAIEGTKSRHTVSITVAKLLEHYAAAPLTAGSRTRHNNGAALKHIIATATGQDADAQPISVMDGSIIRRWFDAKRTAASAETDQQVAQRILRSANSMANQAAGVVIPRARDYYASNSCDHPSLADFYGVYKRIRVRGLPAHGHDAPTDQIVQATLAAWETIEEKNLFLAVGFALAFGLRLGEITQARWSWLTEVSGAPFLDSTASTESIQVKNKTGRIQVRALDPFFTTLRARATARGWIGSGSDPVVVTPYGDLCRGISRWLRALGWRTQKAAHALRDYAGSMVILKYGPHDAQAFLRHASVTVTERHYSTFVNARAMIDRDSLPIHWATVTAAPVLTILPKVG
jgi:integrase